MHKTTRHFFAYAGVVTSFLIVGYLTLISFAATIKPEEFRLLKVFPSSAQSAVTFDESIIASPLLDLSQGRPLVIVPSSNGEIAALDGVTGALEWRVSVPTPIGQTAQLVSTPIIVNNNVIVLYQCIEKGVRTSHRLAVIDLAQKKLDDTFPVLALSAEKTTADGKAQIKFNPPTAYSHSALKYTQKSYSSWGKLYAAFGNAGDTQPFHGWLFEIDMQAWQQRGANHAISNVLLTTPEADCPVSLEYGTQEMICGGGIWTPAGPQIFPTVDGFEIILPVGNGQIDLSRHDYANTLMRVQPELKFNPECNSNLCANFDPANPDSECMASCKNLFIPRLGEKDAPLKPANGECDNKSFWECLAWMDYDLGANAPVKAKLKNGRSVLIQPGKEGAVYLIDADHLGIQYDRLQITDVCGTASDPCKASWMGMIVTQPALTYINGEPIVIIPTFVPDKSHPAGLTALKIVLENGNPKLKRYWQFPDPSTKESIQGYRSHSSLPVISTLGQFNDAIVWSVDTGNPGNLYGIRVKDGAVIFKQSLQGTGRQLSTPLIYRNTLYLVSTFGDTGKSFIEAYQIQTID